MSAQEAARGLFDRAVRHRIALERYAAGELRDVLKFLQDLERDTLERVTALRVRRDLTRGERSDAETLEKFLRELRLIYAEGYALLRSRAFQGFEALARFEAEFQTGSLAAALEDLEGITTRAGEAARAVSALGVLTPTAAQVRAVIRSRPLQTESKSALLSAWFDDLRAAGIDRVESALRIGFVEGETVQQLRARLANVWTLNKRGAEAVIRTAITHIAAEVAQESYLVNGDLVQQVEWVSILDSRTTPTCRARDGKRYPLDKGPRPPAHVRCRSTVIPIMDGIEPPDRPTYGEWLKRQSDSTIRQILGPTRYALFVKGKLPLDRFVADDGSPLTLAQLRELEPRAFARAGLGPDA